MSLFSAGFSLLMVALYIYMMALHDTDILTQPRRWAVWTVFVTATAGQTLCTISLIILSNRYMP